MEPTKYSLRVLEKTHDERRCETDGIESVTTEDQVEVETLVGQCIRLFRNLMDIEDESSITLNRKKHTEFLLRGLQHLSSTYECLDASRPWMCYWIVHSLRLLAVPIPEEISNNVVVFLDKCQSPNGGFGGGPGQFPHLAPTYAAVNTLCELGTEKAFSIINRPALQNFLYSRRLPDGSFTMHEGGEIDIRGAYCALSAARLTNVATAAMFDGTAQWIVGCQTYEGGFAGSHGAEAHGGYSFCGLAALVLLNKEKLCDMDALLRWTAGRQMSYEGGFQGRTNKLVDGCYSFWQGGAFPVIHMAMFNEGEDDELDAKLFHQGALQEYVLLCCQHPAGGLVDKPGKPRDYYHTCYCLSGLSTAQHFIGGKGIQPCVIGRPDNELKPTHPVYNIAVDAVVRAGRYFNALPVPGLEEGQGDAGRHIEELE